MMSDSYMLDASWVLFAVWSVIVATVSVAAFGRDLLPCRAQLDSPQDAHPTVHVRPDGSDAR